MKENTMGYTDTDLNAMAKLLEWQARSQIPPQSHVMMTPPAPMSQGVAPMRAPDIAWLGLPPPRDASVVAPTVLPPVQMPTAPIRPMAPVAPRKVVAPQPQVDANPYVDLSGVAPSGQVAQQQAQAPQDAPQQAPQAPPVSLGRGGDIVLGAQLGGMERSAKEVEAQARLDQDFARANAIDTAERDKQAAEKDAERERQAYAQQEWRANTLDAHAKQVAEYDSMEIDPRRLTRGNPNIAIIAALSGFSGDSGGMDIVNKAIERDIASQRDAIAKKGDVLDRKKTLYGDNLALFKDANAAADASKATLFERYARKTESLGASVGTEKAQSKAADLAATYRQKATELLGSAVQLAEQRQAQAAAAASAAASRGSSDARERNKDIWKWNGAALSKQLEQGLIAGIGVDKQGLPYPIGFDGKPMVGGAGQEVEVATGRLNALGEPIMESVRVPKGQEVSYKEQTAAYANVKAQLDVLKKLRAKHNGGTTFSPDDQATADSTVSALKLALKDAAKLGALSQSDIDIIMGQIPKDPLEMKAVGMLGYDPIGAQITAMEQRADLGYKQFLGGKIRSKVAEQVAEKGASSFGSKALDLAKPVK